MQRTARLLTFLAVLVGLLAMHGGTDGHSAMGGHATADETAMAATVVEAAQKAPSLTAFAPPGVIEVDRPSQPAMTSKATLCLAVRGSDLTRGPRGRATQTASWMAQRSGLDPRPERAGPAPRPPDLVAGLCVSRT